jgi:hypothetical protein
MYTLDMPNPPTNLCKTIHASQLKWFVENDPALFLVQELEELGPVIMEDRSEEYVIEKIIDEKWCGKGWYYLVQWKGWGAEIRTRHWMFGWQ